MTDHSAIFISYRRADTADAAGRIYDRLISAFGEKSVFKDVDSIPFGSDFANYIVSTLQQCRVVLVLIGQNWLDIRDQATGDRRLDNPDDYVRIEVETALQTEDVQVIPVLVSGAAMPLSSQLPPSLSALCKLNAAQVRRDPDFSKDMNKLIQELRTGVLTGTVVVEPVAKTTAEIKWDELKNSVSVEKIMLFADSFPGTEQGYQARERASWLSKAATEFEEVQKQHNYENYLLFLKSFPGSPQAGLATEIVATMEAKTAQAYQDACAVNSASAIEQFMSDHPHAANQEHVLKKYEEIKIQEAFEQSTRLRVSGQIKSFLEQYPEAPQAAEARAVLTEVLKEEVQAAKEKELAKQRKAFEESTRLRISGQIKSFLEQYPEAPQAEEARALLTEALKEEEQTAKEKELAKQRKAFEESTRLRDSGQIRSFLERYPEAPQAAEALALLSEVLKEEEQAAKKSELLRQNEERRREREAEAVNALERKKKQAEAAKATRRAFLNAGATITLVGGGIGGMGWSTLFSGSPLLRRVIPSASVRKGTGFRIEPSVRINNGNWIHCVTFSPDGKFIVSTGMEGSSANVWDSESGALLGQLQGHSAEVYSAAFSGDGDLIITASRDGTARIWDSQTRKSLAVLKGGKGQATSAALSADGLLAATSHFGEFGEFALKIWDVKRETPTHRIMPRVSSARSVKFAPSNNSLLVAVYTNASVWAPNAAGDYELVARLTAESQNFVWSAEYSPDGRRIVTASADKNARIWNAASGREISVLSGHQEEVRHATFSPDGTIVATASSDGTARIWDASTAEQIGILRGHADRLTSVAYSPDGRRLLTASVDGSALFWDVVST